MIIVGIDEDLSEFKLPPLGLIPTDPGSKYRTPDLTRFDFGM